MSGNSNEKSDLGFLIFLILAIIILIPLGVGFDNFESLLKTMKIILGVVFGFIIIALGISAFYFYKRKIRKKINVKIRDKQKNESNLNEYQS